MISGPRFCGRCGGALRPGAFFCVACGARVPARATPPAPAPPPPAPASAPPASPPPAAPMPESPATQVEAPSHPPPPPAARIGIGGDEPTLVHPGGFGPPAAPTGIGGKGRGRSAPQSRHRALVAAVVVVALLAAGGGAYLLVSSRHPVPVARGRGPRTTTSSPASSSIAVVTTTAAPSTTLPPGSVNVEAVAKDPEAAAVATVLDRYFRAIDTRNWNAAFATFTSSLQSSLGSPTALSAADTTSTDSRIRVLSVTRNASGAIDVGVDFRSHQAPGYGPVPGQTCTDWTLSYRLVPTGAGLGIAHVSPVGAGHHACPPASTDPAVR